MTIERVELNQIIDLRHEILRAGLPRQTAIFPADDDPGARHYGALDRARVVGCATLHPSQWEGEPAWQLRGMAVTDSHRGKGIGRQLLEFIEFDLKEQPVRLLWCNARVPAAGFYRKFGWRIVSEAFDIPTAGPHVKMMIRLK